MEGGGDWSLDRSTPSDGDWNQRPLSEDGALGDDLILDSKEDSPQAVLETTADLNDDTWRRSPMLLEREVRDSFQQGGISTFPPPSSSSTSGSHAAAGIRPSILDSSLDKALMEGTLPDILTQSEAKMRNRFKQETVGVSGSILEEDGSPSESGYFQGTSRDDQSVSSGPLGNSNSQSAYQQYFNALQANFRRAQAEANHDRNSKPPSFGNGDSPQTPEAFKVDTTENDHSINASVGTPQEMDQVTSKTPVEVSQGWSGIQQNKRSRSPTEKSDTADHSARNAREQKRAQKITDLIDQIRANMEDDGKQIESRSKFHILSKCSLYLKEVEQATIAKEKAVLDLKNELKDMQNKLQRKVSPRTDYDSVTSSLTSASTWKGGALAGSKLPTAAHQPGQKLDPATGQPGALSSTGASSSANASSSEQSRESARNSDGTRNQSAGKVTTSGSDSSKNNNEGGPSSNEGGSSDTNNRIGSMFEESARGSDGAVDNSMGKVTTSGSSSESTNKKNGDTILYVNQRNDENSGSSVSGSPQMEPTPGTGTIVSDAAVASRKSQHVASSSNVNTKGSDSDTSSDKDPPLHEVLALPRAVDLDYENVFVESSVPQIVTVPSGRIVACNEAFLRMAGLRRVHIGRITLFSLVRSENLSELFEALAQVLNPQEEEEDGGSSENSKDEAFPEPPTPSTSTESFPMLTQIPPTSSMYKALTLPCVKFPLRRDQQAPRVVSPLFATVTMLSDTDPRKRCIHCVFSNCRGTNGKVGILSPDLLEALFSSYPRKGKPKRGEPMHAGGPRRGAQHRRHQGMEVEIQPKNRSDPESSVSAVAIGDNASNSDEGKDSL